MSLPGAWPTKPCMPPPLTTLETTKSLSAALHGAQSQYEMLAALQYAALEKCANRRARLGLYDPLPSERYGLASLRTNKLIKELESTSISCRPYLTAIGGFLVNSETGHSEELQPNLRHALGSVKRVKVRATGDLRAHPLEVVGHRPALPACRRLPSFIKYP